MYICEHFSIKELVSRGTYQEYEQEIWKLWMMFDDRLLRILDLLRSNYGPAVVNTWFSTKLVEAYGYRDEAGLRVRGMKYYKPTSQHSFGRAFDMLFQDHLAVDVRSEIVTGDVKLPHSIRVEKDVSWFHVDTGNTSGSTVLEVNG